MGKGWDGFTGFLEDAHFWPADIIWGGRENDPLFGQMFDDGGKNQEEAVRDAMAKTADAYGAYRADYANNQMNAARNIRGLFEPSSQMLGEMTGGKYQPDLSYMHNQPVQNAREANAKSAATYDHRGIDSTANGRSPFAKTVGWDSLPMANEAEFGAKIKESRMDTGELERLAAQRERLKQRKNVGTPLPKKR